MERWSHYIAIFEILVGARPPACYHDPSHRLSVCGQISKFPAVQYGVLFYKNIQAFI